MTNTDKLNRLFKIWSKGCNGNFAKDGIVSERNWPDGTINNKKILFIMKETNNCKEDIRELIYNDPSGWNILGYWSYALQHTLKGSIPSFEAAQEHYKNYIKMIAALNLKKRPGGKTSKIEEIQSAAEEDKEFILKEIAIIDPQIVVCCGTFETCHNIGLFNNLTRVDHRVYLEKGTERVILDHIHPVQYSIRKDMSYYSLAASYQKCYK